MPQSPESAAAIEALIETPFRVVSERANPTDRPKRLYHFTDASGTTGILSSKSLWASLATALNDATEVVYAVERAKALVRGHLGNADRTFFNSVEPLLEPSNWLPEFRIELRPYVISFCARADLALQWLHYGRSGGGVAISFDALTLEHRPFDLIQVLYEPGEQDQFLSNLIRSGFAALTDHIDKVPAPDHDRIRTMAAHIIAQYVWAAGAQLKDPVFKAEEEWRLFMLDTFGERVPPGPNIPPPTKYRTVSGRVVPYKEYVFDPALVKQLVLGNNVPMTEEDHGLKVLLRDGLGCMVSVSRSTVPVRP